MPITVERTLYQYSELSDAAKENAKDWWLSCRDELDYESVISDFVQIAEKLGITLDRHDVQLMGGSMRSDPSVWWSVNYCQDDFAAFDGCYSYVKGAAASVKKYAPNDEKLHRIADTLQAVQARNFYRLSARIKHHHYYGLQVEVEADGFVPNEGDGTLTEAFRDLSTWLYDQLWEQDEYLRSAEQIEDAMSAHEYTFTEDGRRED